MDEIREVETVAAADRRPKDAWRHWQLGAQRKFQVKLSINIRKRFSFFQKALLLIGQRYTVTLRSINDVKMTRRRQTPVHNNIT